MIFDWVVSSGVCGKAAFPEHFVGRCHLMWRRPHLCAGVQDGSKDGKNLS